MRRLTATVRQQLLEQNDGFSRTTYYKGKNFREECIYTISDGELHIRRIGKTSWADSRFDDESTADDEQTHRFLRKYKDELDWSDID